MSPELKAAFEAEMQAAQREFRSGALSRAMRHLETAHVLGQYYVLPHVRSHWAMLQVALRRRARQDAWGQVLRILLGALGSAAGKVPRGNTGGSNVSMFRPMPIPAHLEIQIERDRSSR